MPETTALGYTVKENYTFTNLQLLMFGFDIVHMKGFKFGEETEIELTYGKNGMLVGYGIKKFKTPNLNVSLMFEEMEKLINAAAAYGGRLGKLPPMPLVATMVADDRPTFRYTAPAVKVAKYDADIKEGNTETEVPLDLIVLGDPILIFQ